MDVSPSILRDCNVHNSSSVLAQCDIEPTDSTVTTVQDINVGSRKRSKQKRRRQINQEHKYRDEDPLGLNFEWPCNHNTKTLQCKRITTACILKNRKRFFNQKTKSSQDIFLTRLIAPYAPERRRESKVVNEKRRRRQFSTTFYLTDNKKKPRPVCKALFQKVFSIKKDRVHNIAKVIFEGGIPTERRGGDRKSHKSLEKRNKLREFLNKLPANESHYTRTKTRRIYLACDLNQAKLRKMYNYSVPSELQVKKFMFQKVFVHDFNIGFKSPASDTCSTCILLLNQIKVEKDPEKKRILMTQKRVHSLRAKAFYNMCKRHIDDPESFLFCFDLQQVQPLPRTTIQEAFYARQISFYNLCFVGMDSRNPVFYQWTENQSGRGCIEVGSALLSYLDSSNLEGKKVLRLFCDGCGGQNKNSHIVHALLFWLVNKSPQNIEEICLTFPVRGHSFLPADRVFGRVEKQIRSTPIIIKKEEYEEIYREHGTVKKIGVDWELANIKSLEDFYKKIEGIRDLKRIQIKKYNVQHGRNRNQTKTLYQLKCFKNYINESDHEKNSFCILKKGKKHPNTILYKPLGHELSLKKKQDVKGLFNSIQFFGYNGNQPSLLGDVLLLPVSRDEKYTVLQVRSSLHGKNVRRDEGRTLNYLQQIRQHS